MADVRADAARYNAELAQRIRAREQRLPRPVRKRVRWWDKPDTFLIDDEPPKRRNEAT